MKVVIFTQYFPPEVGATQTRLECFARHLAGAGHDVTVIAEVPNHPTGVIFPGWRGKLVDRRREHGYEVLRVWVATSPKKSFWRRIAFYATYALGATLAALVVHRRRPDVVLASSPPLPVLVAAWASATVWRRPYVADIRDLWPAVGVALGELRGERAVRLAERLERFLYRKAAAITCVTRGFVRHVDAVLGSGAKTHLVPNGTLPEVFDPARVEPGLRERLGLDGALVVGYVGLHGIAQALGAVLDAAALLRNDGVDFLFVGEGPVKADLVADATRRGLDNVVFHPQVPMLDVTPYINACDVMLVPLCRAEVLADFIPSKLFDFLCCAKPVVLMVDGEARELLEESGGGVFVEPEDAQGLARTLRGMRADPSRLAAMGAAGRAYVTRHYLRAVQAASMEQVLQSVRRR